VRTLAPGTENFIRGVLRGLVRERRSLELGDESPFRLMNIGNGQLVLQDLATKRQINLNAFGQTNASSFAQLFDASST
jgi:putative photosynthetic complex assembly protein